MYGFKSRFPHQVKTKMKFLVFIFSYLIVNYPLQNAEICVIIMIKDIEKEKPMKKIAFMLVLITLVFSFASCDIISGILGSDDNDHKVDANTPVEDSTSDSESDDSGNGEITKEEETPDDSDEPGEIILPSGDDINSHLITVNSIQGLNEQIVIEIQAMEGYSYRVFYRLTGEDSYTQLDSNLIVSSDDGICCYVLGITKGNYDIKIEAESDGVFAAKTYGEIFVDEQDRSGYAHFGYDEGIGAYNSDGTVKEGTTILYVTNENKNTITMTIKGTEYVGLVDIMQKLYQCENPVLIRVIGKITTNQWNYKNVAPRLVDGSNDDPTFFENTFSSEYGENLANLKVRYTDKKDGKTYTYKTTPDGLGEVRVTGSGTSTTTYKGSDFPSLYGKTVYDDDSFINVIEVQAAKNVTIEGVGCDAEFFQFGVGFEECQSIEVKNLTFTNYPEDALNFIVGSDKGVNAFGNYWVHNNTFNAGYNAWDITGERDKYAGDGTIDMAFVHNVTIAYNKFDSCKKTMLVGNSDSVKCKNITIHHNYFYKVGSRIPLSRGTNIHSYNNYFDGCSTCSSIRVNTYLFSEANYFNECKKPFDLIQGAVKSYGDWFVSSSTNGATIVTNRADAVNNNCKPDGTDYSAFDTDSTLFYYDADNGESDVMIMLDSYDVPQFAMVFAGAGVMEQLVIAEYN